MTSLSLSNNFIRDMSPLAGLTNLNYLALDGNSITNWAVLATVVSTNDVMFNDRGPAASACFYRIKVINP